MKRVPAIAAAVMLACALALALAGCGAAQQISSGDSASSEPREAAVRAPLTNKTFHVAQIAQEEAESSNAKATVLIYMNGSDLESVDAEATIDLAEMLESGIGKNANVVIETLGTSEWHDYGIASDHTQRYIVNQGELELVDDSLGQLDATSKSTLSDFISWGVANYPAQRYILLLWNHGAGPVWGFGHDEFQGDNAALTLDEMQGALAANDVHFDIIGMDCCLMSSLEVSCVIAPYCDYAVLSEDFEPSVGWSYESWMSHLEANPAISSQELGTMIVDDSIASVESSLGDGEATLALIDESVAPLLYSTWVEFAYANEDALMGTNFSQMTLERGRALGCRRPGGPGGSDDANNGANVATMSDYYVTDILAVASSIDSDEARALEEALRNAIVHFGRTSGEVGMTGMGVTLPYGDAAFYDELVAVFANCGFDDGYIAWLGGFVDASGIDSFFDYESFDDSWYGWDYFVDDYDWSEWASLHEYLWTEYEGYGWYDKWYDDQDGGWFDYFHDTWSYSAQ